MAVSRHEGTSWKEASSVYEAADYEHILPTKTRLNHLRNAVIFAFDSTTIAKREELFWAQCNASTEW